MKLIYEGLEKIIDPLVTEVTKDKTQMNNKQYTQVSNNFQESPKKKIRRSFKFSNQQKGVIFNNFEEHSYHELNKQEKQHKNVNKSIDQQINVSIINNNSFNNNDNQKHPFINKSLSINLNDISIKSQEIYWKYSSNLTLIKPFKKDVQNLQSIKKQLHLPYIQQNEKKLSQINKNSKKNLLFHNQNTSQSQTYNESINKPYQYEKNNQDINQEYFENHNKINKKPLFNSHGNLTKRTKTENSISNLDLKTDYIFLRTDISQYILHENIINSIKNRQSLESLDKIKQKYFNLIENNRLKFQLQDLNSNKQIDLDQNQICKDLLQLLQNDEHTRKIIINFCNLSVEQFIFYVNKLYHQSIKDEFLADVPLKIDLDIRDKLESLLINRITQDVKGISNNQINNIQARFRKLTQNFLQRKLIDDIGGIEKVEILVQSFVQKCQNEWLQINETHISQISNVICDICYDKIEENLQFLKTLTLTSVEFYVIKLIGYQVCTEQQMPGKMKFEFLEYITLVQRMFNQTYFNKKLINIKLSKNKQLQYYIHKKHHLQEYFVNEIINSMFGQNKLSALANFIKENFQNYNIHFIDLIQEFLIQNIFDKPLYDQQLMKHYLKIQIIKLKIILCLINDFSFIFIRWNVLFEQFHYLLLDYKEPDEIKIVQLFDFTFLKSILQMSLSINNNLTVFDIEQGINYNRIPKDVLKKQIDVFIQMIENDKHIQCQDKQNFAQFIKSQISFVYFDAV